MKHSISIFLVLLTSLVMAQESEQGLAMISNSNGKVIKLRWAPTTWQVWKKVMTGGVYIDRHVIRRDGELLPLEVRSQGTRLNADPIKPWQDQDAWKALAEEDDYAAIGAQAIFGRTFQVVTEEQGGEASLLDIAKDQQNRFSFGLFAADHSFRAATAMGLALVDSLASASETYVYQVVAAEPGSTNIDTGFASASLDEVIPLPKIIDVSLAFESNQAIIAWNKKLYETTYVSYTVERSDDGVNFSPVHAKPLINPQRAEGDDRYMMYVDSFSTNGVVLHYRVIGNTAFDEQGPPSDVLQGLGIEDLPFSFPVIESVLPYESDDQFGISWRYNEGDEELILGFKIYRADKVDGQFELLNPNELMAPNLRFFVDENPLPTNYYKVVGIDQYDREVASYAALAQLADATPPVPPVNVRGTVMEDGTMVITWDENSEADLLGYRVWMSNDSTDEFTQMTTQVHPRNVYLDSTNLNTLSREIYIKVAAYDYRQNMSDMSLMATLVRPDTIPPSTPVIRDISFENEMVKIEWVGSGSDDLASHELWYRPNQGEWQLLKNIDAGEETIRITDFQSGAGNFYQIRAVDVAGLSSESQEVSIFATFSGGVPVPWNVRAVADRRSKAVVLEWEYLTEAAVSHFIILRADGVEESVSTHQLVAADDVKIDHRRRALFRYSDHRLQMNSNYLYAVRAVLTTEQQSPISETIQIQY